ncbi:MAG: Cna B-type domain-containing protein [Ruminococcus sp.]|nr:Cna B-type domain-containing protein [Ruminococcus sp.]
MNINQKIQEFLTEHQYQKKRRIFTAVLSLMIVFSVVSSLIMPAISMTMQDLDDAAAVDTIDAEPAEENIMLLGESAPIDLITSSSTHEITITDKDANNKDITDNDYNKDGNSANLSFFIKYTLLKMKNRFDKNSEYDLYIDYDNLNVTSIEDGKIFDSDYSVDKEAATYTFDSTEKRIKIKLTQDYIDNYVDAEDKTGDLTGSFYFSGTVNRKNDASGDQIIKIGGEEITVKFQDKQAGVEKNYWVDSSKGEIEWTITVKPNGLSLKDYTLVDNMLQNASGDVFINPSSAATYNSNDKKVTFDESNTGDVTITYRTKIGTADLQAGSVKNEATLQKDGENPIKAPNTVYLDKTPVTVNKDGKADYENGKSRNKKIDWTITIASKYGTSLNDYQIIDNNLPESGVTISPDTCSLEKVNGVWTLKNADDVKEVTLNYSTTAQEGNNTNSVSVNYPDGKPTGGEAKKPVNYKKESEMISVDKKGDYNQDTHEITWTIQVTPVNGYSLKDYYLEDSQFPTSAGDFQLTDCNTSDFKIENGRLTFTSDIQQAVTLQYKTKVSVPENNGNAEVTTVVTNEIKDKFTKTTVVSVSVKSRNTIAKTARSQNMSLSQSNAISQEFSWKVDITRDGSFDGYIYQDTLTAPENGTHTITDVNALKILAKTDFNGNATELKKDTDYKIVEDTNGFHIEFLSTTKDYNYISFEYNTTATIPADAAYGQYTFNNKGSSNKGGGEPNPGVTIEKKNPVQTIDMNVRKDWANDNANVRPSSITFKVQYQENNTGDWKDLKQSGNTYLFDGDSNYASANVVEVTLTSANKESDSIWKKTVSNLPVSVTKNDTTTKTYQYRVQEIKYNNDTAIKNGEISINSGIYRADHNGISSVVSQNNGEATVINKYYPYISLTPVKDWKDSNNQTITNYNGDITEITVVLVSKNSENSDGKFYPVKDSSGNPLTATLKASNGWKATAWNGLSSEKNYLLIETAVKLKDGTTKNLFSVSDNGTDYNSKEMSFAVNGTYYKAALAENVTKVSSDTNISVTNTVYETKNLQIGVTKSWSPSKPDGVSGVVVELQRKASNLNDWTAYPENDTTKSQQTLNDSNSWHASWSNLPNQNADSTGRISYTYRVVEVDYVKTDGTKVAIQNNAFALAKDTQGNADGLYRVSYQNQELTADGTVTITNKYETLTSIELTPEKKWTGDNETVRPTSITLQLQRKAGENGEWQNVEGKTITLNTSNSTVSTEWDGIIWKSNQKFTKLPTNEIKVNPDGSYTETKYSYRLIETGYVPNGSSTSASISANENSFVIVANGITGKYTFTSTENSFGSNGTLTLTNNFKEDVGMEKSVIDKEGKEIQSIDAEDLKEWTTIEENGEKYYVFNWLIRFKSDVSDTCTGSTDTRLTPVIDVLPDGFTLCEGTQSVHIPLYGISNVSDCLKEIHSKLGSYYPVPLFTWRENFAMDMQKKYTEAELWDNAYQNNFYYYTDNYNGSSLSYNGKSYSYDQSCNEQFKGHAVVIFNRPVTNNGAKFPFISYSTKIKCTDLDREVKQGNYVITNNANRYLMKDNVITDEKSNASASLIIKNQTPTDLITKTYQAAALPGYISYTLDINPQGKTLSSGDTIDIEDLFKTVSYYDSDWNGGETTNGENLVDVLMRNINIYKIDANGDKQRLSASEYTLQFDCSENGVQSDGEKGAALLKLTVPDATHLQVTYSYKIIANKNTPSVIHGCKVRKNGRYVPMESGLVPPAGDKITFSNTAKLKADSASGESSHNNQEYTVFQSGGTISTNPIPKIYKVNTGDYTIKSLNASFLLAKYESGNWYYASKVNADGAITWGNQTFSGKMVPKADATDAYVIKVEGTQPKISLEQNVLYKLVEISVPAGYEGSNLNLSSTDFRALVTGYLNSNLTTYNNKDYATFLNHYNPNHYFSFNSNVSGNNIPHDVSQSEIQQIKSGDDLNIPNNELIDIGVQKQWVNSTNTIPKNASITVELYWSYEKSTSGIPASATLAKAKDLGILDSSFNATKTLTNQENAKVWTDLPNGKAGKPIYYYVKETAYTYGSNTYTLQEDGSYKKDGSDLGGYLPIYQNNAANGDATVQIQNTQRLMLKKVWKNVNNEDMKPLSNSVDVTVFGIKVDAAGNETKEALFETPVTLDNTNSWQLDITSLIGNKDLSVYKRFEVTETGVEDTSNMVISCVFNLNQNTGEIIVTNKSTQPTDASVTVQKAWSDGKNLHDADTVSVDLYQSTTALPSGTTFSLDWLNKNATKLADKTVTLNKDNDWSYTWAELPLKNDSDQPYYYYVWEDTANSTIANKDKYTATYTKSSNSTAYKTNYTITNSRSAITVQKQWYDEDGNLITNLYDEDGNLIVNNMANLKEITLKVYKKTGTVPTDSIGIVAFGDSITDGYNNSWETGGLNCSRNDKCYPSKLTTMLTAAGFKLKNNAVDNQGQSTQQIGDAGQGFRSRVGNIPNDTKIVCLLGGTNDIHQSGSSVRGNPQGVFDRLQALIGEIKTQAPNATIFVGSIPHFDFYKNGTLTTGGDWWNWLSGYADKDGAIPNGLIDQYNAKIKAYAEKTDGVYFVDVCSVVTDDDIRADGCHPNEAGYTKIATAYSNAIQDYYTNKEPVQENGQDLTITLNNSNNWRAAIDVPADNGTYCVEEVNVPDGWDVTYENNAQQANSTTPILVKNQKQPTDINLTVEKTWAKDDASNRPSNISLTLLRSNGKKQDNSDAANESEWFWEELRIPTPTPTTSGNRWTFAYTGLPASDAFGNAYHYKVQEAAVSGYTVSYGLNGAGEENGVTAAAGETATLHVTNTRAITLQIEKQWSDGETNQHLQDAVRVRIYRSTNPSDVPTANLTLQVTPETVSVGVNGTATVTANKKITVKEIANDTIANATISEDGKTLTITGKEAGTTTITVTDGTMEKQISVTVSVEPTLNLDIEPKSIQVGETATLTPSMSDGSDCSGVTYSITANTDVVSISGNTVTGSKVGTATIVAERNGKTSNPVTITVTEPPLNLNPESVTVSVGDTATIHANRTVTISQAPVDSIATVTISEDGKDITVTGVAAGSTSFTVKDSDGNEKTVSVTVNPQQVANGKVLTSWQPYEFEIPADKQENIKKLEVSFKDYPTNKSNDGVDVYFNAFNKIDSEPNSWIKFNDDGSMKDLYIFKDSGNYFSKETRDGYTFGTVSGNTAIWEKTTASKNEKIIFRAKAACTITQIKITYEDGTSYTVIDFGGGTTPTTTTTTRENAIAATISQANGDYNISFTKAIGNQVYLLLNLKNGVTQGNGCVGFSVTVDGKSYWVSYKWDVSQSGEVAVSLDNPYQISCDNTDVTDATVREKVIAEAQKQTSAKVQVWWADGADKSNIELTGAYILKDSGTTTSTTTKGESGSESGGGSSGGESGETKTVTLKKDTSTEIWFKKDHSDVAISSITIDAKGLTGSSNLGVNFGIGNDQYAASFYIGNYGSLSINQVGQHCKVSLSGTVFTIDNFECNLDRIIFQSNAHSLSGDVAITINYATTPQSLSAPRRAVAAAAVIESEQLLSATNETAGVQTQALENTIDASEVSDSDWASGLLLEINATNNWQGSVTNLSVTDSNGNTYYYWAVEEPVTGYTPSYLFQDADVSQSNAIKADAQVDGTDIIILNTKQDTSYTLPSTGGTGVTRYYLIGLLLMGGSGLVVCYQFRRKRHGNCAK